jgi:uncharacterized protein (TIGR00255 family)
VLHSMTGYGEASHQTETLALAIELRTLNNRYLKVSLRAPEPYHLLEPQFEKVVRRTLRRGTVSINLRAQRQYAAQDFRINAVALRSYLDQVRTIAAEAGVDGAGLGLFSQVLSLPGVVPEPGATPGSFDLEEEWPLIEGVLEQALSRLQEMRREEGRVMAEELLGLRDRIHGDLEAIRRRAPLVGDGYRERLCERVRGLLSEMGVPVTEGDLIREVALFAERSDVSEETVRLASHLDQFKEIVHEPESAGRKLEFLTQEMFREANTIGSKSGDVEISRHVVEIKATLEKVKELVQNVE